MPTSEKQQTLGVFTFDFALKGILSLIPETLVLRMAVSTLPDFMRTSRARAAAPGTGSVADGGPQDA